MESKDRKASFFCMLINPEFDASGKPISAEIVGDFLDVRSTYAPPYPSHIGTSTTVYNPEYPGKENVLVGPILNGYDLSSWAQIPSGKNRVMFLYRPKNNIKYFDLDQNLQNDVLIDTTLVLDPTEVYTLHLLEEDFHKMNKKVLLRKEMFYKQPLSDSLVYVNFYNYSSKGFVGTASIDDSRMTPLVTGIRDSVMVYLTIFNDETLPLTNKDYQKSFVPGFQAKLLTSLIRNTDSDIAKPYVSFPIWANPMDNGISTKSWQLFDFIAFNLHPGNNPYANATSADWVTISCLFNGSKSLRYIRASVPNLLINIHSGYDNPRSFGTVNTFEIVNNYVYLTTIQRKYAPPIY